MKLRPAPLLLGGWALAALGGLLLPVPPVRLDAALAPPGPAGCGCDSLGRPLCTLLAQGASTAAAIGLLSVAAAAAAGIACGTLAGLRGGWVDALLARAIDVVLSFPGLLLAVALAAALGPGFAQTWLALTLLGWPAFARVARGETLHLRATGYVDAARVAGASPLRLLTAHVGPGLARPLRTQAALAAGGAVLGEAALSFLGLGDPAWPSWGAQIAAGMRYLREAPFLVILPGALLAAVSWALLATAERAD